MSQNLGEGYTGKYSHPEALRSAVHLGGRIETSRGEDIKNAVEGHEGLPHGGLVHPELVHPDKELSGLSPEVSKEALDRKNTLYDALLKARMRHP